MNRRDFLKATAAGAGSVVALQLVPTAAVPAPCEEAFTNDLYTTGVMSGRMWIRLEQLTAALAKGERHE